MKTIFFECISCWIFLAIVFYFYWKFSKDPHLKFFNIFVQFFTIGIAFTGLIISFNSLSYSLKIDKDKILPKLQVKPVDISETLIATSVKIDILNYSEYTAKNIFIDIKFGNHPWKRELTRAESKDAEKSIEFETKDRKLEEILEKFYNQPICDELRPGKAIILSVGDENKDFWSKQKMLFRYPDGKEVPIPPTETSPYRRSQGWGKDLHKIDSGEQIKILIRAIWENEIGKKFDRIVEYSLICTKIGAGYSYTFVPSGLVIEDI